MQICPNDKSIEIFAQRFHYFEDAFYNIFALNLLFQDTSYSRAVKYSSFSVVHFLILIPGSKSVKFCPKNSHFSQISHFRGNTGRLVCRSFKFLKLLLGKPISEKHG